MEVAVAQPCVLVDTLGDDIESDSGFGSLVDELAHGMLVTHASGRILQANQAARIELARQSALVARHGALDTVDPDQSRVLQEALSRAAAGRRSLLRLGLPGTHHPLHVALIPLKQPHGTLPRIGLVLSRPSVCDALMLCFFARTHGLTSMEEQVLGILCQGFSAPEAARQLDVAVSTVRSHVRSLCAKTQSSGVRALVKRVAVLPPLGPLWVREAVH